MFNDIRDEQHELCDGRQLVISPDIVADFRNLPFDDASFGVVVFDPPHLERVGENSWMGKKYGRLTREQYEAVLAAIEPVWNGEGLPPLNTEIEFILDSAHSPKWQVCKVMGISEFGVAIEPQNEEWKGNAFWWPIPGKGENVRFRPIRSEADRKRHEAAAEVQKVFDSYDEDIGNDELARFGESIIQKIIAGKIPHLKIV